MKGKKDTSKIPIDDYRKKIGKHDRNKNRKMEK